MGTNYYLVENVCECCGRGDGRLHIGKSSVGWCFALHVDSSEGLADLAAWKMRWSQPDAKIVDEYGERVTPEQMLKTITERQWKGRDSWDERRLRENHAVSHPSGLARHAIGAHCVGHGDGTYDLIPGEFS